MAKCNKEIGLKCYSKTILFIVSVKNLFQTQGLVLMDKYVLSTGLFYKKVELKCVSMEFGVPYVREVGMALMPLSSVKN